MANFFIQVFQATLIQIIFLFGIFFIFGFILSKIQTATLRNYTRSVGWRGLLWTAWLGTPVHEYSHALFALLFRHRINDIVLFSPDSATGELGHVDHSYDRTSFYQSAGNFFIGLAPLIFGPLLLAFLLYILVPQGQEIFRQLSSNQSSLLLLTGGIKESLGLLFSWTNLASLRFWIFLYISFGIASHIAPSQADRRGAWRGLSLIVFYLFLINIIARLADFDFTDYIANLSHFLADMATIYIYVLIISSIHFLVSFFILWPWRKKQVWHQGL
jgi:hypothetical protein